MAYKHGVYTGEIPTAIVPPVNTQAGLPVVFGTAPLHLASNRAEANRPVLCYSYAEAVQVLGYSENWGDYTLCEAIYSEFALYNVAPIVFVNVLDPAVHKKAVDAAIVKVAEKKAEVKAAVLLESLVINSSSAKLTEGIDYEAAYDDNGVLIITLLDDGSAASATELTLTYDELDPSAVTANDIIGGVSVSTGKYTGLELVNNVYPMFGMVPGMLAAPGWSDNSEVAAVMKAKAESINGLFKAVVLTDIPTDTVTKYTDVSAWKNDNNYVGVNQAVCWPMVTLGGAVYHMSTHLMGVIGVVDSTNDDIPYGSPSNKVLQADGLCLADGTEIVMGLDQANYLNGQGVVTGLNFVGGWKMWGNRTGCYPSNTDPKDAFLCVRRMFNWHSQTFILTYWSKVDKPITRRLIDTIVDSENIRINGLTARGFLLGGRVEFLESENPKTDLIDGIIRFHTYLTPPTPAREIENTLEFDTSYFDTLFA